jgi:hypothetical protein
MGNFIRQDVCGRYKAKTGNVGNTNTGLLMIYQLPIP